MEMSLGVSPYDLAFMSLCQGVMSAASGPMWGNLVDAGYTRKKLLFSGVLLWGVCTILLAYAHTIATMSFLRGMNGIAVAMLLPVTQSFVYDLSKSEDRGLVFGTLYFSTNIGQVLACFFVTPISSSTVMGMEGWRFALCVVGFMSLLATMLVPLMVVEAPRPWRPDRLGPLREARKLMSFLKIPTFNVIVLQGIFGTIPGAAFSFLVMYFQYIGISDFAAALVISLHVIGDACGGLLGGVIGDALAIWSPRYGRAITAQISAVVAIPIVAALFLMAPRDVSMTSCYAGILFMLGLTSSWVAPGCICPVMCDIVPRSSLGSAYAWELAIVFCSGNVLGPLLVGVLSERVFGYQLTNQQVNDMEPAVRQANARALGNSLFFSSAVPYAICAIIFVALFFTHHQDSRQRDLLSCSELDDEPAIEEAVPPATEATRLAEAPATR
jgi:MFS family permease